MGMDNLVTESDTKVQPVVTHSAASPLYKAVCMHVVRTVRR